MALGVIYLLTGVQHAARLVVSLQSLRHWYSGPITLFTTRPESHEIGELCRRDATLKVSHAPIRESTVSVNSSYATKVTLLNDLPYEECLYLDADTLVCGEINELLYAAKQHELLATSAACWSTTDPHRRILLEKWLELKGTLTQFPIETLVKYCLENSLPAINTGVYAIRRNAAIISPWMDLALAGYQMPIPDEISLQLLMPHYDHVLFGTRYNARPGAAADPDIRIWHFFAGIHLTEDTARRLWLPAYEQCVASNTANIRVWSQVKRSV